MPTMIRARESTANIPAARRVVDVSNRIHYLDPEAAPFTLLARRAGKRVATNSEFKWIEKQLRPGWDQVNNGAGYSAAATAIVVDNPSYWLPQDLVNIPRTAEKMRVTAVDTTTSTLTVVRGVGSTAAAAINDNDDLQRIGSAFAEGADVGTEISVVETYPLNYTQIHRSPFGETGTESVSENYGNQDRKSLRKEHAIYHKIALERAALFGERNIDSSDTNAPRRLSGGFLYYVTTNVKDASGTLTEPEVEDFLEDVFAHTSGADTRVLFASPRIVSVIDMLAMGRLQTVPSDTTYGIKVNQWVTSHGTLFIVKHRLLENGTGGTGYAGHALAVNPNKVKYAYLRGRDTKLRMDVQNPGVDGWTDEYLTECGKEIANEQVHGVIKGVTG